MNIIQYVLIVHNVLFLFFCSYRAETANECVQLKFYEQEKQYTVHSMKGQEHSFFFSFSWKW